MRCATIQHDIPDYLDGRVTADAARAMETHMADCPACAAIRDGLRPAMDALHSSRTLAVRSAPGPDFLVRVNARLDAPRRSRFADPVFLRIGVPAIAATLLLAIAVAFWPGTQPAPMATFNAAELESILASLDTAQIAVLSEDVDAAAGIYSSGAGNGMPGSIEPEIANGATPSLFSDLSYREFLSGSSSYLSQDDLLDLASGDPAAGAAGLAQ
ncbi:MAG: zf-HC2 domain-containing protein [Ignavibacteria bacterium]|nr:zf-HC2 domain-containing protein [Ignavibacteria bacterium]